MPSVRSREHGQKIPRDRRDERKPRCLDVVTRYVSSCAYACGSKARTPDPEDGRAETGCDAFRPLTVPFHRSRFRPFCSYLPWIIPSHHCCRTARSSSSPLTRSARPRRREKEFEGVMNHLEDSVTIGEIMRDDPL